MKNKKRWLAGFLAAVLVISTWTGSAWADPDRVSTETMSEAELEETLPVESETETEETSAEQEENSTLQEEPGEETSGAESDTQDEENEIEEAETSENEESSVYAETEERAITETDALNAMMQDVFAISYEEFSESDQYREIYVAGSRREELTDEIGSARKPYISLQEAYRTEKTAGTAGIVIHLMDSYTIDNTEYAGYQEALDIWPEESIPSIIVSDAEESVFLNMSSVKWSFTENTGFYGVKIELTYGADACARMFANGHTVVFGGQGQANFNFINAGNLRYPTLFGASSKESGTESSHSVVASTCIKVYGGTWAQILGGGEYYSDVTGTAVTVVDGSSVGFDPKGVSYMKSGTEAGFRILGGGAGTCTGYSETTFGRTGATEVRLKNLTLDKAVTPAGGFVDTKESLTVENCKINAGTNNVGISVRAPGRSASAMKVEVIGSTVTGIIGSFNYQYVTGNIPDSCEISILEGSEVDQVTIKGSNFASGTVNNMNGISLVVKDSTLGFFHTGSLWSQPTGGSFSKIEFDHAVISRMYTNLTTDRIDQIILRGMGSAEQYFPLDHNVWGEYSNKGAPIGEIYLEDSYVEVKEALTLPKLETKNSHLKIAKNISVGIEETYQMTGSNAVVLADNAELKLSGTVEGTSAVIESALESDGATGAVRWSTTSPDTRWFSFAATEGVQSQSGKTGKMAYWSIRKGEASGKRYIYLDASAGHDEVAEYGEGCSEATLGYSSDYPVQTMDKAYSLAQSENDVIVVCADYSFSGEEDDFISAGKAKDFQTTVTSRDDFNDFQTGAAINLCAEKASFLNLNGSFRFENITFKREGKVDRVLLCNGYATYMDATVTLAVNGEDKGAYNTNHRFHIYGGSRDAGVESTSVQVYNKGWKSMSASGFGTDSYVGDPKAPVVGEIALLQGIVNSNNPNYEYGSNQIYVTFEGSVYGSVRYEVKIPNWFARVFYPITYSETITRGKPGTVTGDFITQVTNGNTRADGTVGIYAAPEGITVGGDTKFIYQDEASYSNALMGISLPKGSFSNVDIAIENGSVNNISLFHKDTSFEKLTWNIGSKQTNIYGADGNASVEAGKSVQVTVNGGSTVNIRAGASSSTITGGYYTLNHVKLTLRNFKNESISRIFGFGEIVIQDSHNLDIASELAMEKLSVDNCGIVKFKQPIQVGTEETKAGTFSVLHGSQALVENLFIVNGDVVGVEAEDMPGTLLSNYVNEEGKVYPIKVSGSVTGTTYFSTDYETAQITAEKGGKADSFQAVPPAYEGQEPQTVRYDESTNTWTIGNPIDRNYVYVDGQLDPEAEGYANHDGSSPEYAYATIEEAYNKVVKNGSIVICGDITVSAWPTTSNKSVTITGKVSLPDGNQINYYDSENMAVMTLTGFLQLRDDTVFEYINFGGTGEKIIAAYGHTLRIGRASDMEAVTMTDTLNLCVAGGACYYASRGTITSTESHMEIYGGRYNRIVSGTYQAQGYQHYGPAVIFQTSDVTINGADVNVVTFLNDASLRIVKGTISLSNTRIRQAFYASVAITQTIAGDTAHPDGYQYQVTMGKNMVFDEGAECLFGYRGNDTNSKGVIDAVIDGSGGEAYTVPLIRCGGDKAGCQDTSHVTVSLKNAKISKFYGAGNGDRTSGAWNTDSTLILGENAWVDTVFAGGVYQSGKAFELDITDSSAAIQQFKAYSERNQKQPICLVQFDAVGSKDAPYRIGQNMNLDGCTEITVNHSVVDISDGAAIVDAKQLSLNQESTLLIGKKSFEFTGSITASSDSLQPTVLYLNNAANMTVDGSIEGYFTVLCKNSVDEEFRNGCHIYAKKKLETNTAEQFKDLSDTVFSYDKTEEQAVWYQTDRDDTDRRTGVYVASYGNDTGSGAYAQPVKTFGQALKKADELYRALEVREDLTEEEKQELLGNIRVVLIDDITLVEEDSQTAQIDPEIPVTVDSFEKAGSRLHFTSEVRTLSLGKPVNFEQVILDSTQLQSSPEIYACGHPVSFSEKTVTEARDDNAPILYGGAENTSVESAELNVFGGIWKAIYGGGKTSAAKVSRDVSVNVGGQIDMFHVGEYSETATGLFGGGMYSPVNGSIKVTVNGGIYHRIHGGGKYASAATGDSVIYFNSGECNMLYGGGESAPADKVQVYLGGDGEEPAVVNLRFRGGSLYGACDKVQVWIQNQAVVKEGCEFAGGGYSGLIGETELQIQGGTIQTDVYAGGWGEGTAGSYGNTGKTSVNVSGGVVTGSVYGGGNLGNVGADGSIVSVLGGQIQKNVYGGCNVATVSGDTRVMLTGGSVEGKVFGGGRGTEKIEAKVTGTAHVNVDMVGVTGSIYGGCDTNGTVTDTQVTASVLPGCQLYGGGYGEKTDVTGTASVKLAASSDEDAENTYNVYGGGEQGKANQTEVTIENWTGDVYGGGKGVLKTENPIARAFLRLFTASDLIDAHVPTTNVVVSGTVTGDVFAGGEYATVGTGAENVTVSQVTVTGTVTGNVYGGGKGEKEKEYAAIQGSTLVSLKDDGRVNGSVFGGGQNAPVAGDTKVQAEGGTYEILYGGNDISGEIKGTAQVEVSGGTAEQVYAGGYGADTAKASAKVTGGQVTALFGGGNAATVTERSVVTVNTSDGAQHVDTVFAGNNQASMAIKPTLNFASGKIGTVYCGGNEGVMTYKGDDNGGICYEFDYPNAEIDTVFAGCNNTTAQTADVQLQLISGTYGTVYGGNNENGFMAQTGVVVNASTASGHTLTVDTIYGGGNHADAKKTAITVRNGQVPVVYGGGNAATVTGAVTIELDAGTADAEHAGIKELYCGNNQAEMTICPSLELKKGTIESFYGGGNKGAMTCEKGLTYTFDSDELTIGTIYGGGNQAGVTGGVTLNIEKGHYTAIYGGSNSEGLVDHAAVNVLGDVGTRESDSLTGAIFGGGRGQKTRVTETEVRLQGGVISGNVYGGSGFGRVESAKVTAKEAEGQTVQVLGSVFGAGYGMSSSVGETAVDIALDLRIATEEAADADVLVTETLKSAEDKSGESMAKAEWKQAVGYTAGSYIAGNVFGGGDMGKVGDGYINVSTNTAVIEEAGIAAVTVESGYIRGNVFGGGNGQPGGTDESGAAITEYNVHMGTVFGTSEVKLTGGYVNGNVFGCGQQSRTYAAADSDGRKDASVVTITTEENGQPVVIGGSIFGGGNKGNGTNQNASVATVYGDTHVTLSGKKGENTPIYLLSNGTTGGGVYGDGNLCLVSGKKYVTLENFSCGIGENSKMLKTFYSLQRADQVDLIGSRIVLKGAVDLVAENADDTQYSINRVSELNLKESSTIKVTKTVNLLGSLTSDEQPERQFIDRGNNTGNAEITGNEYTASGGNEPDAPLTKDQETAYIQAYETYMKNGTVSGTDYKSINVVCVANGGYLEVKKSASQYGPVTGLFTLQLVNANPGEGGGFVYADILGKQLTNDDGTAKYVTGNFICVTKQADTSDTYMYAYHNVGGQLAADGTYEYYVWYLKGNKYSYDVELTGYIGTQDTDFTKTVSLSVEQDRSFILTGLKQTDSLPVLGDMEQVWKNTWDSQTDGDSEKLAVEVTLVMSRREQNSIKTVEQQIGYLGYQTGDDSNPEAEAAKDTSGALSWGIWRSDGDGYRFQVCKGEGNSFQVTTGDALAEIGADVVGAQLVFTLHKGTDMMTEFRNLPFELRIAEAAKQDYDAAVADSSKSIEEDSCIRLTTNLNLSAIRLVPTQAAYMASGRMFAGVSSSSNVSITKTSAFTAQFVTKYIPSAFNTGSDNRISEVLTTEYQDIYLLDENGVGYTVTETADGAITLHNVVNQNDSNVKKYAFTKEEESYRVSYLDGEGNPLTDEEDAARRYSCKATIQSSGFQLPKGTVITLLASLDEGNPTYWYYYCTEAQGEIDLSKFVKMNTENGTSTASGATVYDTIFTTSSSRVTENMIFVFDFSNVASEDWKQELGGHVMLRHWYSSGSSRADIMDYVSSESATEEDQTTVSYKRETPRYTENFKISAESDGVTEFDLKNGDSNPTYGQQDPMNFTLQIIPDSDVTNTQYEEREYAVVLKLQKKTGDADAEAIAFPEGTIFTYQGKQLTAGSGNRSVIVPVQTVGKHEITVQAKLEKFEAGDYTLTAELYSTSAEGYFNSIPVSSNAADSTTASFTVIEDPVYALGVRETREGKNHFAETGEAFAFEVTAKQVTGAAAAAGDDTGVQVSLYRYEKKQYLPTVLDTVLSGTPDLKTGEAQSWTPTVKAEAAKGTYRLAFTYHDRTEYWDFIVR